MWWRPRLEAAYTRQASVWLTLSGLQANHCTVSAPELLSVLAGPEQLSSAAILPHLLCIAPGDWCRQGATDHHAGLHLQQQRTL